MVGERWTLLVVRELLLGPRRFTDLLAAGPAPGDPDLVIRTGQAAFIELSLGRTGLADLVAARRAQVSGDAGTAARAALLFSSAHHPKPGTDPRAAQKEEQQA